MRRAPIDTRTPEQKAAGVSRKLDFLDELDEPWKGVYESMKARQYEQHVLPVQRWEDEGGR